VSGPAWLAKVKYARPVGSDPLVEAFEMVKTYRVSGTFRMGDKWSHFVSDVHTESPERAREKIFSDYGSRHHLSRRYIKVEKVEEVKAEAPGHTR